MSPRRLRTGVAFLLALSATVLGSQCVHAQQAGIAATSASATQAEALRPAVAETRPVSDHPLEWVLKFAHEERAYLQQAVRDFTCRVTKRERIDGELQDYYYIDMRVREQTYAGGQMTQPLSVLLTFLGPSDVTDRTVNGSSASDSMVTGGR